jgi:YidC/Oxa1 family membrane protein insertase
MRHAPFFGWIRDLSAPDPTSILNLFGLLPFDPHAMLPAFVSFLSIGIWPILMGVSQWFQTKLNPAPADPVQARMFSIMPLIFMFMLSSFPAGLVIYWTWSNLLSMLQQYVIMRREGAEIHLFNNLKMAALAKRLSAPKPGTEPGE